MCDTTDFSPCLPVLLLTHFTPYCISLLCLLILTFTAHYLSNAFCSVHSETSAVFEANNTSMNHERNQCVWLSQAEKIGVYGISQCLTCQYWLISSVQRSREMSEILVCFVYIYYTDKTSMLLAGVFYPYCKFFQPLTYSYCCHLWMLVFC